MVVAWHIQSLIKLEEFGSERGQLKCLNNQRDQEMHQRCIKPSGQRYKPLKLPNWIGHFLFCQWHSCAWVEAELGLLQTGPRSSDAIPGGVWVSLHGAIWMEYFLPVTHLPLTSRWQNTGSWTWKRGAGQCLLGRWQPHYGTSPAVCGKLGHVN